MCELKMRLVLGHWRDCVLRRVCDLFARQQIAERNLYFCATILTDADAGSPSGAGMIGTASVECLSFIHDFFKGDLL
jgi:hypothetical protein